MFTGLIEQMGTVRGVAASPVGTTLVVQPDAWPHRAVVGDSIAVDGCCLTIAELVGAGADVREDAGTGGRGDAGMKMKVMAFVVVPQTLALTTLGSLRVGDRVHLEPSATLATLLGGHLVQGHVDGVGEVVALETQGQWRVRVRPPRALMEYLVPQGSVCVAGVSLTIAALDVADGWFEVALIPTTLAKTTLGALRVGSRVNLECDAIAKQVAHWLRHHAKCAAGERA